MHDPTPYFEQGQPRLAEAHALVRVIVAQDPQLELHVDQADQRSHKPPGGQHSAAVKAVVVVGELVVLPHTSLPLLEVMR